MVKPGIRTTEFPIVAGSTASLLAGVVTETRAQVLVAVLAGAYTFARTVLKAVHAWRQPPPPTDSPPAAG